MARGVPKATFVKYSMTQKAASRSDMRQSSRLHGFIGRSTAAPEEILFRRFVDIVNLATTIIAVISKATGDARGEYGQAIRQSGDVCGLGVGGRMRSELEMWANGQCAGRPAEYRWRPLFNAAKFG